MCKQLLYYYYVQLQGSVFFLSLFPFFFYGLFIIMRWVSLVGVFFNAILTRTKRTWLVTYYQWNECWNGMNEWLIVKWWMDKREQKRKASSTFVGMNERTNDWLMTVWLFLLLFDFQYYTKYCFVVGLDVSMWRNRKWRKNTRETRYWNYIVYVFQDFYSLGVDLLARVIAWILRCY